MVLLRTEANLPYSEVLLSELGSEKLTEEDDIVELVSGEEVEYVHRSLLSKASPFLHQLISSSSCNCERFVINLPNSFSHTLSSIVTLIYNGFISGIAKELAEQVIAMAGMFGLDITTEIRKENGKRCMDNLKGINDDSSDIAFEENIVLVDPTPKQLKIKGTLIDKQKGGNIDLSFPEGRLNRVFKHVGIEEKLGGFHGRVQSEYNKHPVGQYMGPYDQNKDLKLNIQLPYSDLEYSNFTEFHHSGNECYELSLESYTKYDDLSKIDSYTIVSEVGASNADTDDDEPKNEKKKYYSCKLGKCKIPCPCPKCHLDVDQCKEHRIRHCSLFNEKADAVSIRSSEEFCLNKRFFDKSYIIKYSGIPLECKKCKRDLLFHHCYHFEYHDSCRFCKPSWYKYKAKSGNELKSLEKNEEQHFRRVCPYCDKQFLGANEAKRHIQNKHVGNHPFKCDKCLKVFDSVGGKEYHEKCKHSSLEQSVSCHICKKGFAADVSLKAHLKYAHSGEMCN